MKFHLKSQTNMKSNIGKVATDMLLVQSIWSLRYLTFVFIAHNIVLWLSNEPQGNFIIFSQQSSRVYMLIIGIIAFYFLAYYVKQGVTRKDYFFGAALAAIGLSIVIPVLSTILNGLQQMVINLFDLTPLIDNTPFLGVYTNWLAIIFIFAINILTYYIIGWVIGTGYYRYGWIIGFGFIAIGITLASTLEFLWTAEASSLLNIRGPGRILILPADIIADIMSSIADVPIYVSFIGNALLLGVGLWVIRMVTKKVAIKVN